MIFSPIASCRGIRVVLRLNFPLIPSLLFCVALILVAPALYGQTINVTAIPGSSNSIGTLYFGVGGLDFSQAMTCPDNANVTLVPFVFTDFEYFDINNAATVLPGTGLLWTQPDSSTGVCPTPMPSDFVLTTETYKLDVTPQEIMGDPNEWSGTAVLSPIWVPGVNVFYPKYYVLSLLYAPPGNASSSGLTDTATQGATSGISESFTQGTSFTAGFNFLNGIIGISDTSGMSASTTYTSSFTTTTSNASGLTLKSTSNSIDHSQDTFLLWLNPMVVIGQTGPASGVYFLNTPLVNGQNQPADVMTVSVKELLNPSLIPASKLGTQLINGASLPGLSSLCANPNQCTAADFASIIPYDPLAAANPTVPPSDTTRYVSLLTEQKDPLTIVLQGPDCSTCDPIPTSYTVTDANNTTESHANGVSETQSYSASVGTMGIKLSESGSWTWSYSTSIGTTSGLSHTGSVSMGSSTIGCEEHINVYMDSVFHTLVFVQPTNNGGCD